MSTDWGSLVERVVEDTKVEIITPVQPWVDVDGELLKVPHDLRRSREGITEKQAAYIADLCDELGYKNFWSSGASQLFRTKAGASALIDYFLRHRARSTT